MKTMNLISVVFSLFVISSCNSAEKTNGHKVTFGIYETVMISEMPKSLIDTLKSMHVQIENNQQQPVIGYISKEDSMVLQLDIPNKNLKLVKTYYTIDKDKKYYAIGALKQNPFMDNSHIQKTKANGNNVEIYFDMEGAKKWADFTKKNIGKAVAFVIDNQIYALPHIKAEIRNGVAIINGFSSTMKAKNMSESLNNSY